MRMTKPASRIIAQAVLKDTGKYVAIYAAPGVVPTTVKDEDCRAIKYLTAEAALEAAHEHAVRAHNWRSHRNHIAVFWTVSSTGRLFNGHYRIGKDEAVRLEEEGEEMFFPTPAEAESAARRAAIDEINRRLSRPTKRSVIDRSWDV